MPTAVFHSDSEEKLQVAPTISYIYQNKRLSKRSCNFKAAKLETHNACGSIYTHEEVVGVYISMHIAEIVDRIQGIH